MAYKNIIVSREETFGIVTLNRPPVNALNSEVVGEFAQAVDELEKDPALRSIIFVGAKHGERETFCGGADLSGPGFSGDVNSLIDSFHVTLNRMERCSKPIIAAINGHAFGGGCEVSLACHFRIMKKTARIGLTESNLGIIPGAGGTQRLPRVIGRSRALHCMIFGTQIPAEEALSIGLVHQLSEEGKTLDDAKDFARKLAERAPLSTFAIIQCVAHGMDKPIEEGLKVEKENFLKVVTSSDAAEGIQAFFQKRKANFQGK